MGVFCIEHSLPRFIVFSCIELVDSQILEELYKLHMLEITTSSHLPVCVICLPGVEEIPCL